MVLNPGQHAPEARVYSCSVCRSFSAMLKGEIAAQCPKCSLTNRKQVWLPTEHGILVKTQDVAKEFKRRSTWVDIISDEITAFCGNMNFVYIHVLWFSGWILYNMFSSAPFDPFPFGLLTLVVSLEAIILATFILIAQNRHGEIADLRSELDYHVNLRSEKIINELRAMISEIYATIKKK